APGSRSPARHRSASYPQGFRPTRDDLADQIPVDHDWDEGALALEAGELAREAGELRSERLRCPTAVAARRLGSERFQAPAQLADFGDEIPLAFPPRLQRCHAPLGLGRLLCEPA